MRSATQPPSGLAGSGSSPHSDGPSSSVLGWARAGRETWSHALIAFGYGWLQGRKRAAMWSNRVQIFHEVL